MKKLITKSLALFVLFLVGVWNVNAQDLTITQPTAIAGWTSTQGVVSVAPGGTTLPTVSSGTATCLTGNTLRLGSNAAYLQITATNPITHLAFNATGNSTGTTVYIGIVAYSTDGGTTWCSEANALTFTFIGYDNACTNYDNSTLPVGTNAIRIWRKYVNGGSGVGSGQTIRMGNLKVWAPSPNPNIALTTGSNTPTAMETLAMTPAVYTYANVVDPTNNVISNWYTDNTYTATTTGPLGLSFTKDLTAKTVTLGGTPATGTVGTYYYKVKANETGGNAITGTLTIAAYITPAPVITLTNGAVTQTVKAGSLITDIVYSVTNATGALATGLPTGVSGNYVSTGTNTGTVTITGTIDAGVTPSSLNYTITGTPILGYVGSPVNTTGTIKVKSSTATDILYIIGGATLPTTDILYPYLDLNSNNLLTLRTIAAAAPASTIYDPFDLIIVHESVSGGNAELNALKAINKPILNFKSFEYNAGRWVWGNANNGSASSLAITVKQSTHPIFDGIDGVALNSTIDLISAVANSKGIQPADVTLTGSINVATALKDVGGSAVAIHDVPGSVRGAGITSKYLMIPIFSDSYQNLTTTGKTLIDNAINYLLTGIQFVAPSIQISSFNVSSVDAIIDQTAKTIKATLPIGTDLTALQPAITLAGVGTVVSPATIIATDFSNSLSTPVSYTVSDGINSNIYLVTIVDATTGLTQTKLAGVTFDGQIIHNNANSDLQVYDVTGRKVATSNKDINMSSNSKGIYIVKSINGTLKITLVK